jgi:hypothetical protein
VTSNKAQVPKLSVPAVGEPITFRNYVVGFFDILGQREHLSRMGPIPSNEDERKAFEQRARHTVGAIHAMRTVFNAYFANYIPADPPGFVSKLPTEQRERVLRASEIEAYFQGFSDTLIVFMPVTNRHDAYQWRGLHSLFAACATLVPTLLGEEVALRGAVELGVGVEFVEGEIYGPVLQRTYELESRLAGYPRIVVGDALVGHLERYALHRGEAEVEGISGEAYDRHSKWLGVDADGVSIVDYLGKSAREMLGDYTKDRIKDAYHFICREERRFEQRRDEKLVARYALAKRYYETRCSDILGLP